MDITSINETILSSHGFEQNVGMEFFSTDDPDTCMAKLHVEKKNMQPFGFLSGGAILALAETLAGVGSSALCPDCICMGIEVNASHVHSAKEGETVTAVARIMHKGSHTHLWRVDVSNESGELVSTINVTNYVKKR